MDAHFLTILDKDNQSEIESIEEAINTDILVKTEDGRTNLGCTLSQQSPVILIPNDNFFPDSSVFHELLHIRRFYVENVPKIIVCDNYDFHDFDFESNIASIDNELEHLIIVPNELESYPRRKQRWEQLINTKISENDVGPFDILLYYAFTHIVLKSKSILIQINEILTNRNIDERAEIFLSEINTHIDNKPKLVKEVFKHVAPGENHDEALCLEYYNNPDEIRLSDII